MKYFGREFNSAEEIREWSKEGNINYYRNLAKRFSEAPSMELSVIMSDMADILIKTFGLTPDEIEALEIA